MRQLYHKKLGRSTCFACFGSGVLLCSVLLSISVGSEFISPSKWWFSLWSTEDVYHDIIWLLRLPRVCLAMLVGAALALAGSLSQTVLDNTLADPSLLGVSAGAQAGIAVCLLSVSLWGYDPSSWFTRHFEYLLPLFALLGSTLVCVLLYILHHCISSTRLDILICLGMAINAAVLSGLTVISYLLEQDVLHQLVAWSWGTLAHAQWPQIFILFFGVMLSLYWLRPYYGALDAIRLGPNVATHLGVNIAQLQKRLFGLVACLSALCVAWCGLVAFIGWAAPYLVHMCHGGTHKNRLPWVMYTGALLLLCADTIVRGLDFLGELPLSAATAWIFLPTIYLVIRHTLNHNRQNKHHVA